MEDSPLSSLQSEAPGALAPGMRLGKYELIRRLSVGGMAEIFLARARGLPGFQLHVAIKRILPQLAGQTEFVEMFLDEARIAATLQHPHVVQIYDVCVVADSYFIAMEYLHGEDVNSILRTAFAAGRRVPIEHVLQIMLALLSGLHYAHDKENDEGRPLDVVHCDVSPGNVIVTYEGGIKLVDFGIATAALKAATGRTGAVQGKVGYMSPEQARGDECDRRTDVYAAGVMLYELALGRRLYKGNEFEILNRLMRGQFLRPSEVDPSFDPRLEAIILRALDVDREKRFPTAQAMQLELEALAEARGLFLSTPALKRFMSELFGKKLSELEKKRSSESYAITPAPREKPTNTVEVPPARGSRWGVIAAAVATFVGVSWLAFRDAGPPIEVPPAVVPMATPIAAAAPSVVAPAAAAEAITDAPDRMPAGKQARRSKLDKHSKKAPPPTPGFGALSIVVTPWVAVSVDGRSRGQTPLSLSLPAGQHTVLLTNPEHGIKRQLQVEVKAGQTVRKKLDLSEYE